MSRRAFLAAGAGGLAALFTSAGLAATTSPPADPWPVLDATLDHLFPTEDAAPGAREIQAPAYLRRIAAAPDGDPDEQTFLLSGAGLLARQSHKLYGNSFQDLDFRAREQSLRALVKTETGELWVSTLLLYLCEALLADPVYGANPDGIGWAWLKHQPGFPRPSRPGVAGVRGARNLPKS